MSETQAETVTLVVRHQVRPSHVPHYEVWLRRIIATASQCPGHLGVDVVRSRQPGVAPVHQHGGFAVQGVHIRLPLALPQRVEDETVHLVAGQRVDGRELVGRGLGLQGFFQAFPGVHHRRQQVAEGGQ